MSRFKNTFDTNKKLLSIYFTAGFPKLDDTTSILESLEKSGVDLVEIGLPFSDPLADGNTIQKSSTQALKNGMTTQILFEQLKDIRQKIKMPLIVMGYFNPMMKYGVEGFCKKCNDLDIDGLIIPDLPVDVYHKEYKDIFKKYNLSNIFLITPQTSDERIKFIDDISDSFIYMVSSSSTTGAKNTFNDTQESYFERIEKLNLKNPLIVGFGISNAKTFQQATQRTNGAIVGSAFVEFLKNESISDIPKFIKQIKSKL